MNPETVTRTPPPASRICAARSPTPAPPHAAAAIPATPGTSVATEVRARPAITRGGPLGGPFPRRSGVNLRQDTAPTPTRAPMQEKKRAGATPRRAMAAPILRRLEAGTDMPPGTLRGAVVGYLPFR